MRRGAKESLVLCYHAVSSEWDSYLSIPPQQLQRQLEYLLEQGFRGASAAAVVDAEPGEGLFAITFDDGYRSVIRSALPILDALGLAATAFVPTQLVGGLAPYSGIERGETRGDDEWHTLEWGDLRTLVAAGWQVGSHTHTHARLTTCDRDVALAELVTSRELLERELGVACRMVAYPYGQADAAVAAAAGEAGYTIGFTLPRSFNERSRLLWPRIGVYRRDARLRFALKTRPEAALLRSVKQAWPL
jgi:peptidoglycan/xylan/chitin deacetylase (PgdA/CDA1 family)